MKYIEKLEDFNKEISTGITAIDFTATWCGPCKMISPVFEKLESKYPKAKFFKVDVDKGDEIAGSQGINAMPTFKVYNSGKMVGELVGASEKELEKLLQTHCA